MIKVFVLVCSLSVDAAHCDRDVAEVYRVAVVRTPEACLTAAEAGLAQAAYDPSRERVRVLCVRERG